MRLLPIALLCAVACVFHGCAGCSNSGRQAAREEVVRRRVPDRQKAPHASRKDGAVEAGSERGVSDLYKILAPSVFTVYSFRDGLDGQQGSGFLLSKSGVGVSNAHVFVEGGEHYIELDSGDTRDLTLLELNRTKDYAIFRVKGSVSAQPLRVARHIPSVGDDVFAIGSPLGLKSTLSRGIVSNFHESPEVLIQTTVAIADGSSGGPLFSSGGEVVGVTTSGYDQGNLNFAIPIGEIPWAEY